MRRSRAFTLLEMILAIMIVVMLVATMAGVLSIAFKSKRSSEDAVMSTRDIHILGDIMVQELENAAPPNPLATVDPLTAQLNQAATDAANGVTTGTSQPPGYLFGSFYGDQTNIQFYTTGPEPKSQIQSDSRLVKYSLDQLSDGTNGLVRHVETNLLGDTDPTQFPSEQGGLTHPDILVSNIKSVSFQYFDGTSWYPTWDSTQVSNSTQLFNTLPYAISIEVTLNPIRAGGQERVIKRFATLWCADASVNAASTMAATSAAAQTATGGL